jgi:hypothetical protein
LWKTALTFFIGPIHDAHRIGSFYPIIVQDFEHLYGSGDTQDAVVSATRRLGVQMGASIRGRQFIIETGSHGKLVAHGICVDLAAQRLARAVEPISGLLIRVGEGEAGHASLCLATAPLLVSKSSLITSGFGKVYLWLIVQMAVLDMVCVHY